MRELPRYRRRVDEARAVLIRLDRIERLERARAPASLLVAELRSLISEAEAWVRIDPGSTPRAESAIDRLREAVDRGPVAGMRAGRTLLA